MSRIKLLLDVASDLRSLADSLQAVAGATDQDEPAPETKPVKEKVSPLAPKESPVTIEQVRAVLADKSRSGKTAAVRDLLGKFGAAKLSEIEPDKYPVLLQAAEEL